MDLTFLDEPDDAETTREAESTLYLDDSDRYSRLRLIPWWRQEKLRAARVLVVGAGALGNEVLKNLALLGVGTVHVIDLDEVEPSNLSRSVLFRLEDGGQSKAVVAARRAAEINPDVRFLPIQGDVTTDLGLGLFAAMDVVIGCLDNREARLWVNRQCWKTSTPWVDAGIQEIQGVVKVFTPPHSACYECAMTERDYQLLNLRYSCPLLRRDQILEGKVPTAPTIAAMMSALEVQEALKIIHGMEVQGGTALVFNGVTNQFYTTKLPFREDCLSHETYPKPVELEVGHAASAREFLSLAIAHLNDSEVTLVLDRDLVSHLECPACGWKVEVFRPRTRVTMREAVCPTCQGHARPLMISSVGVDSPLLDRSLAELGIPAYDIVRVDGSNESAVFLLAGDREAVLGPSPERA